MLQKSQSVRVLALALLFTGVVGTLGQLLLFPKAQRSGRAMPTAFDFPGTIELPDWQALPSQSIDPGRFKEAARQQFISGQVYRYQQGDRSLNVTMAYVVDTNGRANNFLENYTTLPPTLALSSQRIERYRQGAGYYLLSQDQEHVYLTSCINPHGESTVTLEQFQQNRYKHDIRPERFVRWLFYSDSIRDFRCLWVNFSTPLNNSPPDTAYSTLERAWFFWYTWWQPRFPKP